MGVHIRKNEKGFMEARVAGPANWHILSQTRRVSNGQPFDVKHFVSPVSMMAIYVFNGISMSMLDNHGVDSQVFGLGGGGSITAKNIFYPGRVFLIFPKLGETTKCKLVDAEGRILNGSNIFPHGGTPAARDINASVGNLCLATRFTPLEMTPVDALVYNKANNHLQWKGDDLPGEWRTEGAGSRKKIFHISTWHTWTPPYHPIPQEILDATERW